MLKRLINLPIGKNSFFLFGPRQTGKTTLINELIQNKNTIVINLLHNDEFLKYKSDPSLLRDEIDFFIQKNKTGIVFIDEIQKSPELLDEAHSLIEKYKDKLFFIFTGSSARKLKRVSTNLLAGRAWSFFLFPFTFNELGRFFNLDIILQFGSLPALFKQDKKSIKRTLKAYSTTYLRQEIFDEALVRNLSAFSRFVEIAADSSGEIINYSNIARETGVASKTIKEYYQILEDTLIAFRLNPYLKSVRKRLTQHAKYYLFDIGVINSLCGRLDITLKKGTQLYGILFEHFIIIELYRLLHYNEKDWSIYYWRTSNGAEVDLIIKIPNNIIYAIEVKSAEYVDYRDLSGLKRFLQDNPNAKGFCVCKTKRPYIKNKVSFLPWEYFFKEQLGLK